MSNKESTLHQNLPAVSDSHKEAARPVVRYVYDERAASSGGGGVPRPEYQDISNKLTYFIVGTTIGAVVALMFAPKSGRELRGDIADVTRKGVDKSREAAGQIGAKAGEYYEVTKDKASDLYATAATKASDIARERGEALQTAIDAGKQAYTEEKRRLQTGDNDEADAPIYHGDPGARRLS